MTAEMGFSISFGLFILGWILFVILYFSKVIPVVWRIEGARKTLLNIILQVNILGNVRTFYRIARSQNNPIMLKESYMLIAIGGFSIIAMLVGIICAALTG